MFEKAKMQFYPKLAIGGLVPCCFPPVRASAGASVRRVQDQKQHQKGSYQTVCVDAAKRAEKKFFGDQ